MKYYAGDLIIENGVVIYPFDIEDILEIKYSLERDKYVVKLDTEVDIEVLCEISEQEYLGSFNDVHIEPEPEKPTELEILKQQMQRQDELLEELLFEILPSLMGGDA